METPTVILIGPMCCGKSTIAGLLAEKLKLPLYGLDDLCPENCAGKKI